MPNTLSPFYRVIAARSGRDLTEHITAFRYEDCADKDDLLRLTLGNIAVSLVTDPDLANGSRLLFSFGYLGGAQSRGHSALIVSTEPAYGATLTLNINATHEGLSMKKNNNPTIYQGMSSSDIARKLAQLYGLKADVDETTRKWQSMPTGGRTDYQLMKYLAGGEGEGMFRFAVKNDTLVYKALDLTKPSRRTFTWNDGSGTVLSFKATNSDLSKKGQSAQTTVPGIDPFTGLPFTGRAKDGEVKNDTKLGRGASHFDQDGGFAFRDRPAPPPPLLPL